jgi:hypothetical protein
MAARNEPADAPSLAVAPDEAVAGLRCYPCVIMMGNYPQIQGGQQIPSETNQWASLNLREVTCIFHKT